MKMSKWRTKRSRKGISIYTMSKELGITYEQMLEIDRGERDLNGEYIEKFNEVLNNSIIINENRKERLFDIKNYFMSDKPKEDLKVLGYTHKELQKIFNVSVNVTNHIFNKRLQNVSDDMLERFYDFLTNYINKKIKKSELINELEEISSKTEEPNNKIEEPASLIEKIEDINNENIMFFPVREEKSEIKYINEDINNKIEENIIQIEESNEVKIEDLKDITINELTNKVKMLEHQIKMYEKLIERL